MKRFIGGAATAALALGALLFLPATAASAGAGGCGWTTYSTGVAASCNQLTQGSAVRGMVYCKLQAIHGGYEFTQYGPWVTTATHRSYALCPSNSYKIGQPFAPYQTR